MPKGQEIQQLKITEHTKDRGVWSSAAKQNNTDAKRYRYEGRKSDVTET